MKHVISGLLTVAVTGAIAIDGYWLFAKTRVTDQSHAATQNVATSQQSSSGSSSHVTLKGTYKNGTYTGKAVSTRWGDVQVQAVVKNQRIATVNVLTYPDQNPHDKQVNAQALPIYKSETLKKQSAKIQLVSGASETYKGFTGSLQNALDQAEG